MSIIREFLDKSYCGGFFELNSSYKGIHLEGEIIKLEFKRLYTHLIIKFFDEGLIGENIFESTLNKLNTNLDEIENLLAKGNYSEHENMLLNSLFGLLSKNDYHSSIRISSYMYSILEYYYNKNFENILYIDTDTIYMTKFEDEDFIKSIGVPYNLSIINNIYFLRKKQYIFLDNLEIKTRGMSKKYLDGSDIEDVISEMRASIRNKKLKDLGI